MYECATGSQVKLIKDGRRRLHKNGSHYCISTALVPGTNIAKYFFSPPCRAKLVPVPALSLLVMIEKYAEALRQQAVVGREENFVR